MWRSSIRAPSCAPASKGWPSGISDFCTAAIFSTSASRIEAWRQHPRARMAGLALIVVDAPGDCRRGGVEIGVGHHHMRRFSPAFERDALHVALPGVDQHELADLGRAGEGDHVDVGMKGERLAGLFAEAGNDVEHAVRQPRLLAEPAQEQRAERRLLGRLQHDRIARDQRRAELPRGDDERIVPRHDRADDAERLLHTIATSFAPTGAISSVSLSASSA